MQDDWKNLYDAQRLGLSVLESCEEAVAWTNSLMKAIDEEGKGEDRP